MSPVTMLMSPWGVVPPLEWPPEKYLPGSTLGSPDPSLAPVQLPAPPRQRMDRAWRRAQRKRGGR
jgi:hypothetical protein